MKHEETHEEVTKRENEPVWGAGVFSLSFWHIVYLQWCQAAWPL